LTDDLRIDLDYPRPQLRRAQWTDLGGEWEFEYDDADVGRGEHWERGTHPFGRRIVVPYPPESELSGIADQDFHRVLWYRRTIATPALPDGYRAMLHFGAVDYAATVWVNGQPVAAHTGGHTPFSADITDALAGVEEHVITVRALDDPADATQPRGKQDWLREPHGIWYHRTSGIWQPVWLELVPDLHIRELVWQPDLKAGRVNLQVGLSRRPVSPTWLAVRLTMADELLAEVRVHVAGDRAAVDIAVPALAHGEDRDRLLWRPGSPKLVDATLVLAPASGAGAVDTVHSYLGLRSCGFQDGRFLLNGRPFYLRMVLHQGYWPESHLAAPSGAALRREVELIDELGFNGVRIHQKIEDPRFLAWCDRLGVLAWGEMPSAYEFSARTVGALTSEWLEVLRRDASHPSVVAWVPLNESWGVPHIATRSEQQHLASGLYHLTKAVDGTRPVVSNDGWEHTTSDLWTLHDYSDAATLQRRYATPEAVDHMLRHGVPAGRRILLDEGDDRNQPVILSEFGGLSLAPEPGQNGWGYDLVQSGEELLERLRSLFAAVRSCHTLAGFCYTQLTDTLQETNGLLDPQRAPKVPLEQLRQAVTGDRAGDPP